MGTETDQVPKILCQLQFTLLDQAKGKVSRTATAGLIAPQVRLTR